MRPVGVCLEFVLNLPQTLKRKTDAVLLFAIILECEGRSCKGIVLLTIRKELCVLRRVSRIFQMILKYENDFKCILTVFMLHAAVHPCQQHPATQGPA